MGIIERIVWAAIGGGLVFWYVKATCGCKEGRAEPGDATTGPAPAVAAAAESEASGLDLADRDVAPDTTGCATCV